MRRITNRCRTRKYKWRIFCLVSSVCLCVTYYKFFKLPAGMHIVTNYFNRHLSSPLTDLTTYQNHTPLTGKSRIFEATSHVRGTDDLLFNTSTCGRNQSFVNTTLCSSCLRPGVVNISLKLVNKEYINRAQYKDYFKTAPSVVQNLITDYLITPSLDCPYLLAVQASLKDRPGERDLVRKTWGSVAETQTWPNRSINAKVKILFVVANMNSTEQEKQQNHTLQSDQVLTESRLHNDILYINMVDGYYNLTLKLLSAFKWVKDNCPCTKFVLKVDFDTFVNVPLLIDMLLQHEDRLKNAVLGLVYFGKNLVKRYGYWRVPKSAYPPDNYPVYTSGCGYVLSIKVISQIVDTAPYLTILPIEDAFITGVLRLVIGYQLVNVGYAFTSYQNKRWNLCEMFNDTKVVGLCWQLNKHKLIWDSFHRRSCV